MIRALSAELLKLKRTLAFRMIFVLPLLVALLQFFVLWKSKGFSPGFKLWKTLPLTAFQLWAIFMMPLLITLETALLNGIEHNDHQWKHILALPIPRHTVYFAKFMVAQALIGASTLILCLLMVIVGIAGTHLRTELANSGPIPFGWLAKYAALVWLAAWLMIAIHTWISTRWSSLAVALGAGIAGTFFALFAASASVAKYYPWLLPLNVFTPERFSLAIWLGAVGGIVVAVAGCLEFVRRDVA
jgi:hypothetical protein